MTPSRTDLPAWKALAEHAAALADRAARPALYAADPAARFDTLSVQALDLLYDYSRQRVTATTLGLLLELARQCELPARIEALFAGETVNNTEGRAAMHMALRNRSGRPMHAAGTDVMPEVESQLAKMREFVTGVHQGRVLGFTGARFTDVVNIGIGGSDLGPRDGTRSAGDRPTPAFACTASPTPTPAGAVERPARAGRGGARCSSSPAKPSPPRKR